MKLILAIVLSLVVASSVPAAANQSDVTTEEYAVYSAAITSVFTQLKHIVIVGHTDCTSLCTGSAYPDSEWVTRRQHQFPGLAQEIIDDYLRKSREPFQLQKDFNLKLQYSLVERKEIESKLAHASGIDEIYLHSGGILELSRVAFNPAMNEALVYLGYDCGLMCGTGYFFLMHKNRNGTWLVLKRQTEWNS
jgi:hypothetical protein